MDSEKIDNSRMFSVITVCYNEEENIEKTLESVLQQDCSCFEYIVMDGLSTDKTFDIVLSYRERFREKGVDYIVRSEKDAGIFNAMNKAVALAGGEWVVFMNGGDFFAEKNVLGKVADTLAGTTCDILYGDTYFVRDGVPVLRKCEEFDRIKKAMIFYHQSSFSRRELLVGIPFDEKYRIGADYKFFLDCALREKKFYYMEEPLSCFTYGGISTATGLEEVMKDILLVRHELGLIGVWNYRVKIQILNVYGFCKRFLPGGFVHWLEGTLDKSRK